MNRRQSACSCSSVPQSSKPWACASSCQTSDAAHTRPIQCNRHGEVSHPAFIRPAQLWWSAEPVSSPMHINIWQRVGVSLAVLIAVVFLGAGSPLGAQSVATVARTSIDTTLTRAALDDLHRAGPSAGFSKRPFRKSSATESTAAGSASAVPRVLAPEAAHGLSRRFSWEKLNLTDAGASGRSLLFLDPSMFESLDLSTGMMTIDRSAPGLSIRADLVRPAGRWGGRVDALLAPTAHAPHQEPASPVAALRSWSSLAAFASGPLLRIESASPPASSETTPRVSSDPIRPRSRAARTAPS